ncbi:unnamed protein product [Paramecium octaurelia]|uniref:Endoplasmic reticulum oxidoreductin n=1 Tax=Paramecium octaurelia TaxID=43137 RepID=A0A8S1TWN7_PAROT|nr:unnamed protein product [Paramecium octaurelia]
MQSEREEFVDELTQLKIERSKRRQRKEWELKLMGKCITWLIYAYAAGIVTTGLNYLMLDKSYKYEGIVEDSCQDFKTLKSVNDQIFPLLDELTYKKYFKIFRVNLENDCPFSIGEYICTSKKCVICTCNTSEIPSNWLSPASSPINQPKDNFAFWDSERYLSPSEWIWHVEDIENDKGVYVDLKLNPEAFTGYQGQHIWDVIYRENCYQGSLNEMCKEKRALNKLVQGLHTSISTQLSEFYVDLATNKTYPNYPLYFERVGNHPERIRNLFFLYSVLLRAVQLATPGIQKHEINSMSFEEDSRSKYLLSNILTLGNNQCSKPFDEQQFFNQITFEQKKDYQRYIHNISRIMDCVECQKCRVFGKMQTYGLGTALKILFSESPSEFSGKLKRNELVALINTFGKVSSSVKSIDLMFERRARFNYNLIVTIGIVGGVFIIFMVAIRKIYQEMDKKIQNMFKGMPNDNPQQPSKNTKSKRD